MKEYHTPHTFAVNIAVCHLLQGSGKKVNITGSSAKTNGGFYETLSRSSRGFYDDDEE